MIFGVGTDIVAVVRLGDLYRKHGERALAKILAPGERADCRAAADPARFLAKRFAAKEAFGKALGTGLSGMRLGDIQVVNDRNGRPEMVLHGTALARLGAVGGARVHVSLTHESDNAVAVAIIEG